MPEQIVRRTALVARAWLVLAATVCAQSTAAGQLVIDAPDPQVVFTDGALSLLVSQVGYADPGVRHAFLMATVKADGEAVTTYGVEDDQGQLLWSAVPEYAGHWVTRHFFRLDLSPLRAGGRYRVRVGGLVSNVFPVDAPVERYHRPFLGEMIFDQLRFRAQYDAQGGFIESGNDIRATDSVATLFMGMLDLLERHGDSFTAAELAEIDGFFVHGYDFLASVQGVDGRIRGGWEFGLEMWDGEWPMHLRGVYILLRLARHFAVSEPGLAANIMATADLAREYTRTGFSRANAPTTFLFELLMCEAELERLTGAPADLEEARLTAAEIRRRQLGRDEPTAEGFFGIYRDAAGSSTWARLNTHDFGERAGQYWGLPLVSLVDLYERYPDHPDASTWRVTVSDFVYGFLVPALSRSPYRLIPNGEYDGVRWFSDLFHGMNMTHALAGAWLVRYGELLNDRRLYDIAEAQLLWIGGLNTGFDFDGGAIPFSAIAEHGYAWLLDGHGVYGHIKGSIVNGLSATPQFDTSMPVGPEKPLYDCDESWISHTGAWLTLTTGVLRARLAVAGTLKVVRAGRDDLHLTWEDVKTATGYRVVSSSRPGGPFTDSVGVAASGVSGVLTPIPPEALVFYRATGTEGTREGPP